MGFLRCNTWKRWEVFVLHPTQVLLLTTSDSKSYSYFCSVTGSLLTTRFVIFKWQVLLLSQIEVGNFHPVPFVTLSQVQLCALQHPVRCQVRTRSSSTEPKYPERKSWKKTCMKQEYWLYHLLQNRKRHKSLHFGRVGSLAPHLNAVRIALV